jgi:hypothetical protein
LEESVLNLKIKIKWKTRSTYGHLSMFLESEKINLFWGEAFEAPLK